MTKFIILRDQFGKDIMLNVAHIQRITPNAANTNDCDECLIWMRNDEQPITVKERFYGSLTDKLNECLDGR